VRILLDECVDVRLAASLASVDVRTVADQGWLGISNGRLLALAAAEFDVFVTVDRNLQFQQHLSKFDIAVILLRAKSNRIADLVALVPELVSVIPNAKSGVVTPIGL
jgi:cephalosporin-C deacetylase-like acetyl esterase